MASELIFAYSALRGDLQFIGSLSASTKKYRKNNTHSAALSEEVNVIYVYACMHIHIYIYLSIYICKYKTIPHYCSSVIDALLRKYLSTSMYRVFLSDKTFDALIAVSQQIHSLHIPYH